MILDIKGNLPLPIPHVKGRRTAPLPLPPPHTQHPTPQPRPPPPPAPPRREPSPRRAVSNLAGRRRPERASRTPFRLARRASRRGPGPELDPRCRLGAFANGGKRWDGRSSCWVVGG